MPAQKTRSRKPRFGILMDAKYRARLHELAQATHRTPVKYVEMLLERHFAELRGETDQKGG